MSPSTTIFTVKTVVGQEKALINFVKNPQIKAILVPETIKGYVFVEATGPQPVQELIARVPQLHGRLIQGKVTLDEIDVFLKSKKGTEGLDTGDIVEVISGPFRGEKAKVTRVDPNKDEVKLELFESQSFPIPIKVHADYVKLLEKGEQEDLIIQPIAQKKEKEIFKGFEEEDEDTGEWVGTTPASRAETVHGDDEEDEEDEDDIFGMKS
ncbi:MAG: transcription elongation factor Spt5 [Candidatus Helarchaeota archaeon]